MSNPFPNVRNKLSAPTKKSPFEKQRLEAEAKRLREEAETAAVYKDFVASFDEGPADDAPSRGGISRGGFSGTPSGPGRRHFAGARGGPPPLQPPRKRGLGDAFERDEEEARVFGGGLSEREKRRMKEANTGLLAFENSGSKRNEGGRYAVNDSDSDSAKPLPKPTVLLSFLPPNITKATITDMLSATPLKIDSVRIIPAPPPPGPSQPPPSVRKAATTLVTLSSETPSSDIDSAVSLLNGRYMGYGFWLNIARHLSSTVAGSAPNISTLNTFSNPFGAKAPRPTGPTGMGRGGPHRGGFAPPTSFGPSGRSQPAPGALQVHVHAPQDLKLLKLIHRTIELLLTHGPGFEALLMSKDEVRNDPRFAWLWDARSSAGVYYRWKLWEIVTGYSIDKTQVPAVDIFKASGAPGGTGMWIPPKKQLKYEWAGSLKDVVEDEGFMSDELDEDDSDREREDDSERPLGLAGGEGKKSRGYLGVLERAKLIHLISRMPTQTSKVRRGDVGRVMAFAMEHAEGGMGEEVVEILVSNVLRPLAFTKARKADSDESGNESDPEKPDTSAAKIVALWLISDVLSNSSLGVRAAWRYRQLFDTALRERHVFRHLGEIYRGSGWGRMKAEKFRRGIVEGVLEGWEKWCIFPQTTQEDFLNAFLNPEGSKEGSRELESRSHTPVAPAAASGKSRWKTVDATASVFRPEVQPTPDEDVDGQPLIEDVDGEPLIDEDVDGEPMDDDDDDVDGEPMVEDKEQEEGEEEYVPSPAADPVPEPLVAEEEKKVGSGMSMTGFKMGETTMAGPGIVKRKRPKAEDMFADSD